jgi:hypothetical protein
MSIANNNSNTDPEELVEITAAETISVDTIDDDIYQHKIANYDEKEMHKLIKFINRHPLYIMQLYMLIQCCKTIRPDTFIY